MIKFLIIFINHFTWSEETCETSLENGKLVGRDAIYHLECDAGFAPNIQKFLVSHIGTDNSGMGWNSEFDHYIITRKINVIEIIVI